MSVSVIFAAAAAGVGALVYYKSAFPPSGKPIFSSFGLRSLKVHSTESISPNTKKLRFELPEGNLPSGLSLSASVLTFSFPGGGWKPCLRPYTPTNDLDEKGFLELMVKHYPGGKQSTHIHSLKPGDKLTFLPIPAFKWTPNKHAHLTMIAGGAGVTPMYQLARGILKNPDDQTRISLVWGVNTDADIFLKDQFAALEKQYPGRFKATYVVATPDAKSPYQKGFVTKQVLEKLGLTAAQNKGTKVLVCGPPPMEKALKGTKAAPGILGEVGYTAADIHTY
ncbi:hypothetical protein B0T14DRAFT_432144 [Immersiella caudata]|uniref:FAD-binding FR-type domain-containing protein n=1 Tax=Immersiella caudata TaxID=314043 RepID=A0AA39WRV0_9PEZI|nr:hypothetical protein B0T14DRAFT_432144 [Immersiella caudata]